MGKVITPTNSHSSKVTGLTELQSVASVDFRFFLNVQH